MNRRRLLLAASMMGLAATGLTACATTAATTPFASERIAVSVEGSGSDVILIPGLSSHPSIWDETAAHLVSTGHRVHRVWVSGFAGRPSGANAEGDLVGQPVAEEIARYIADQRLDRPAIIGHSMGGWMGLVIAARHPSLISRLMVVDMMPFMGAMFGPPGATAEQVRPIADQILAGIRSAPPEGRRAMAEQTIAGMIRTESRRAREVQHSLDSDSNVSGRAFHELIVTDLTPELRNITVPVTVLYVTPTGAPLSDAQLDAYYAVAYSTVASHRLVRIPDSAHFIMFDQTALFLNEIDAFLSAE